MRYSMGAETKRNWRIWHVPQRFAGTDEANARHDYQAPHRSLRHVIADTRKPKMKRIKNSPSTEEIHPDGHGVCT